MSNIRVTIQMYIESDLATLRPIETSLNGKKIVILHIELKKPLAPQELPTIAKMINETRRYISLIGADIVGLSGRGPIWAYVYITHLLHGFAKAVGVFDPKLRGLVIVMSHAPGVSEGSVVELPDEIINALTQITTPGSQ